MKKKKILLSILGILLLVLATIGVTYAVFTYTKLGTTENTVTTGTLKFLYTENTGVGNGINIENAFPVSDEVGKTYNTDKYVFDFSVEATNSGTEEIPYEVTLRKKDTSTLDEKYVKVYLTDMTEDADTFIVAPTLYGDLIQTTIDVGEEIEKTIYNGTVLGGELTYKNDFRLRMWIDEKSNQDDINGKTFTALVNVYANVPLVSEEELDLRNSTEISNISINNISAEKIENEDYDYMVTVPEDTTSITIDVDTLSNGATITNIEKVDSIAYTDKNVKRMALTKTFELTPGANYFKITVTSQNNQTTDSYYLYVKTGGLYGFAKKIYDDNPIIDAVPTLTTSSNNTSDASGLYMSTDTNDETPTYYFRGNVENNYVDFAGFTWRIVRINEDGTVRLIMQNGIYDTKYKFNPSRSQLSYMYYTNSSVDGAKFYLDDWYKNNIVNKGYNNYISVNNYFCEQAKVKRTSDYTHGDANMSIYSNYMPDFKCQIDGNGYGVVNSSIGLITYDEIVHAGGYYNKANDKYYLSDINGWTMSPLGGKYASTGSPGWYYGVWHTTKSYLYNTNVADNTYLYPVINLNSNIQVSGTGISDDPYKVQ